MHVNNQAEKYSHFKTNQAKERRLDFQNTLKVICNGFSQN